MVCDLATNVQLKRMFKIDYLQWRAKTMRRLPKECQQEYAAAEARDNGGETVVYVVRGGDAATSPSIARFLCLPSAFYSDFQLSTQVSRTLFD